MKTSISCLLILFALALPGMAEPDIAQEARTYVLGCHLKNFQTALSMWQADHSGTYPETLAELSPNYLRVIPNGPYGSAQDWNYSRSSDGKGFYFSLAGETRNPVEPFHENRPLQPAVLKVPKSATLGLALPSSEEKKWVPTSYGFQGPKGNQYIASRLTGPTQIHQSGEQWLREATNSFKSRAGQQIVKERAVQIRGMRGTEIVTRDESYSSHEFFLTDGVLGWELSYVAQNSEFTKHMQNVFVSMVGNHQRR